MSDKIDIIIGKNLRNLRQAKGLTLKELATSINPPITTQQLQKYETAKNRLSASTLVKFCLILERNAEALFEGVIGEKKKGEVSTRDLMKSVEVLKLTSDYNSIPNKDIKSFVKQILNLAKKF